MPESGPFPNGPPPGFFTWVAGRLESWFLGPWRALDASIRSDQAPVQSALDARLAFFIAAVCLTLQRYGGEAFSTFFPGVSRGPYYALIERGWWVACCNGFYLVVPLIALWVTGKNPLDYGLSPHGFWRHIRLYFVLFAAILPAVVAVSFTKPFQDLYPFYRAAGRSWTEFLIWEALYASQFITLEFFFRGWLLFSLRPALGANAIFAMMVPYCMIHFGKPMLETFGAIGAGLILGTLALRTRSIWLGAALHIAVAWTMDVLSLCHQGQFPPGQ